MINFAPNSLSPTRFDEQWQQQRFEKGTRYYFLRMQQDLWKQWVVIREWGSKQKRGGQVREEIYSSYEEGLGRYLELATYRVKRRKYTLALQGFREAQLTFKEDEKTNSKRNKK